VGVTPRAAERLQDPGSPAAYEVRGDTYRLQVAEQGRRELFNIEPGGSGAYFSGIRLGALSVRITEEPSVATDLDVLVALCCYVALVGETWVNPDPGGAMY
jgi:hypothetical protein